MQRLFYLLLSLKGKRILRRLGRTAADPAAANLELLQGILRDNAGTEYGRKYGFSQIRTLDEFKARLPMTTYDDYSLYVERLKAGEKNLLTKAPVVYFAATSGSVANPKAIPVTARGRKLFKEHSILVIFNILGGMGKKWTRHRLMNLVSHSKVKRTPCGIEYGTVSGMGVKSLRTSLKWLSTTPACSVFATESHDASYVNLRTALVYKKLSLIASAFMTAPVDLAVYLFKHHELLIDDIEKGTIHPDVKVPEAMRRELLRSIKPEPERAAELRAIFAEGNEEGIIRRIWPELSAVTAIGAAAFAPYTEKMQRYAGQEVSFYHMSYSASEAVMALCTGLDSTRYALIPYALFYEFIPIEHSDEAHPDTLTLNQLKEDHEYEIVLTTVSGFYRYRIKDVVRVVGFHGRIPEIRFSYRINQMISLAGEKTNDEHLRWAIARCGEAFGCSIYDYAIFADTSQAVGRYIILIETEKTELLGRLDKVSQTMQTLLSEANPSLVEKFTKGIIGPVEVKMVQVETFALYRDLQALRGISANQLKPVRVIDTPEKERFFFALLERP